MYKPQPHDNAKDKTGSEFHSTALSVLKQINDNLTLGSSASNTYITLVMECNEPKTEGQKCTKIN